MTLPRPLTLVLCLALGSFLSLPALAQQFYQWVDENGVTHFTQLPPKGHVDSQQINVQMPPSSDQEDELQARAARHQAEADARARAQQEADNAARNLPPPPPAPSEAECAQLRANLEVLNRDSIARSRDPETGEERLLHQDERREMAQQVQERLQDCR